MRCFSDEQHENSTQNVKNVDFDGGNGFTAPSSNDNDDGIVPGDFDHDDDEQDHLHHDHLGHGRRELQATQQHSSTATEVAAFTNDAYKLALADKLLLLRTLRPNKYWTAGKICVPVPLRPLTFKFTILFVRDRPAAILV